MVQLHLPAAHTEADLVLAGQIAMAIDSAELYVAWTADQGQAPPAVVAELREVDALRWTELIALVFRAVAEAWTSLLHGERHTGRGRPAHVARQRPVRRSEPAA